MQPTENQSPNNASNHVSRDLSVMQPGERVICTIKRHPIGIISVYVMIIFLLTVIGVIAFVVVPAVAGAADSSQITRYGTAAFLISGVISLVYGMIATFVYQNNRWILTSDSITQVAQNSLFSRQSSQLALESIEDVTAEQNGVLSHILNYGVLKAETAGHRGNFTFTFCPNPNYYAHQILEAREAYEQELHTQAPPPTQPLQ